MNWFYNHPQVDAASSKVLTSFTFGEKKPINNVTELFFCSTANGQNSSIQSAVHSKVGGRKSLDCKLCSLL
jgi:hypothetical protein